MMVPTLNPRIKDLEKMREGGITESAKELRSDVASSTVAHIGLMIFGHTIIRPI